tara:strand:- start:95 stop:673 length:579 start_codon:yes stop_codon:yes gene_type:complete
MVRLMAQSKSKEHYFKILRKHDVSEMVEKKGQFSYLSWADAVDVLRQLKPESTWRVIKDEQTGWPYTVTESGCFVEVEVTVDDIPLSQIHPILDNRNQTIEKPNAFQVNTSIQRCLAKAIALHGLGLYLYRGEDLPDADGLTKEQNDELAKILSKIEDGELVGDINKKVASGKINSRNYEACKNKLTTMIGA